MKRIHLLAATIAAAIALAPVLAEDTTKPEAAEQTKEQKDCCMGMMGMDMGNMMSKWKEQEAELDKLVADMNSAPSDKKVDAIAAVVSKLVEQHKAIHERMQKMMTEGGKDMMKMGRMMMMMRMMRMMDKMMGSDQESQGESEHSQHH
jgi:hypothetical protein